MTIEEDFGKFTESVFKSFGLDSLSSKAISILYMDTKEVAIEELAKKTGYSLASISNKMRMLEKLGMIQRVKKPKSKKVYYFMEKDIIKIFAKKIEIAKQVEIEPAKKIVPAIISKYQDKKLTSQEKEHLKIIKNYLRQIQKMEKAINVLIEQMGSNKI